MGAIVGLINGILVTRARINLFIATLGSGTLLLGLNQWYTGGRQVVGLLPRDFVAIAGKIPFTGAPLAVICVGGRDRALAGVRLFAVWSISVHNRR